MMIFLSVIRSCKGEGTPQDRITFSNLGWGGGVVVALDMVFLLAAD